MTSNTASCNGLLLICYKLRLCSSRFRTFPISCMCVSNIVNILWSVMHKTFIALRQIRTSLRFIWLVTWLFANVRPNGDSNVYCLNIAYTDNKNKCNFLCLITISPSPLRSYDARQKLAQLLKLLNFVQACSAFVFITCMLNRWLICIQAMRIGLL